MTPLDIVHRYHALSKHSFEGYAPGPRRLDWANQPDPFRRYQGAPVVPLKRFSFEDGPPLDAAYLPGFLPPAPLNGETLSRLLFDSLAISAWKRAGASTWALRVNPSSGNLHPTEGYVLTGPVEGLFETPVVAHYAPRIHALEVRAEISRELWTSLTRDLPEGTVLLGLSSIHWREAWKYGERAYRYCQLDIGHALGAIAFAASGLGWNVSLLDDLASEEIASLLGTSDPQEAEPEEADALVAIAPERVCVTRLPREAVAAFDRLSWRGIPNRLSPENVHWPLLEAAARACRKPPTRSTYPTPTPGKVDIDIRPVSLRAIVHQRRSAQAYDNATLLSKEGFFALLARALPGHPPFTLLPWSPLVHLALFVHRIEGLAPGLYFLDRGGPRPSLRGAFIWEQAGELPLSLLAKQDPRGTARQLSCFQDIAADGCFSLAMVCAFENPLTNRGAWFYPRLYWECGLLGQVLYIEAEAAGIRGTGMGCFFDDPTHALLGIEDLRFQDLYHFSAGRAQEDSRLTTLPPYPDISR